MKAKKVIFILLILSILSALITTFAYGQASVMASFTGEETYKPGETAELKLTYTGANFGTAKVKIEYDEDKLSLVGCQGGVFNEKENLLSITAANQNQMSVTFTFKVLETFKDVDTVISAKTLEGFTYQYESFQCDASAVITIDHQHDEVVIGATKPTCTQTGLSQGKYCNICNETLSKQTVIPALGHKYINNKCTVCGDISIFTQGNSIRLWGNDRYVTSQSIATALKITLKKEKFDAVIVASGSNFADAISGTYLAKKKNAPILVVDGDTEKSVKKYIENNVAKESTVYILGGSGAVSENFAKSLTGFKVKRLGGKDRFETNLLILKEAGVDNESILVCSGLSYADCLSTSATGRPILLVDEGLKSFQKTFLKGLSARWYYVIGGTGAVNKKTAEEIMVYGKASRVWGADRFKTSQAVANKFFSKGSQIITLAYGFNFPDGLSGGPLALALKGPLLLVDNKNFVHAKEYAEKGKTEKAAVLGGPALIPDSTVKNILVQ